MDARWERRELLSGAVFAVLGVVAFVLAARGSPEFMPTSDEAVEYAAKHDGDLIAGGLVGMVSVFFLLWFLGSLRARLAHAEGTEGRRSVTAFGGGLVAAVMLLGAFAAKFAVGIRVDENGAIEGAAATTLLDVSDVLYGAAAPIGFAVLVGSVSAVVFATHVLPRWFAWASAVMAVGLLVPAVPWLVMMLVPVWMLAASLMLWHAPEAGRAAVGDVVLGT